MQRRVRFEVSICTAITKKIEIKAKASWGIISEPLQCLITRNDYAGIAS